ANRQLVLVDQDHPLIWNIDIHPNRLPLCQGAMIGVAQVVGNQLRAIVGAIVPLGRAQCKYRNHAQNYYNRCNDHEFGSGKSCLTVWTFVISTGLVSHLMLHSTLTHSDCDGFSWGANHPKTTVNFATAMPQRDSRSVSSANATPSHGLFPGKRDRITQNSNRDRRGRRCYRGVAGSLACGATRKTTIKVWSDIPSN